MKNIVRVWIGDPFGGGHFNGTAFFINGDTLVTAKHVILDHDNNVYENLFLSDTPDKGIVPIDESILCDRDLAILKVKKTFNIDTVYFSNKIRVGKDINIIGFYDKETSEKNYENRISGYRSHEHTYELQNHLTYGLSGSPVLLDGKVCGVACAINSSKNLTYMIPIEEICMEIDYRKKEIEAEQQPKTVSELIQGFLIPILIPSTIILIVMTLLFSTFYDQVPISDVVWFLIFYSLLLGKLFVYVKSKIKDKR